MAAAANHEHLFRRGPGILGTFPADPRIMGVFPKLSATVIPRAQELRLFRGDAAEIPIQIQTDEDPPDPFQVTGGVLRWAAKIGYGQTEREGVIVGNDGALILKRSYDPGEIEFAGGTGKAILHLRREDTVTLPLAPAVWDLEFTQAGSERPAPPSSKIQLLAGSDMAIATGLNWQVMGIRSGDLFEAQGRVVLVTEVLSSVHLRLDFSGWTTATLHASGPHEFALRTGITKTVAAGPFMVDGDVVL